MFEDLTAQRLLAQERRGAEQLQLLTQVVARIADEIKNPLVSINAFMELIGERYDDATFRNQFSSVVGRDVRRLVQIFDKLAALVNDGDYKRETLDLRAGGGRVPGRAGRAGPSRRRGAGAPAHLHRRVHPEARHRDPVPRGLPLLVRGDHAMFKKAMSYLVWYLLRKTPGARGQDRGIDLPSGRATNACASRWPPAPRRSGPRSCRRSSIRSRSSRRISSTWDQA